jgi:tetratricopeptide (TPR) repeat protein
MDENAYRAIGATLAASGYDEQAVEYFLKAEECSKTSVGKFHTLVGLGCSHHNIPEPDKATEVLTRALSLEEEILSHKENDEYTNYLLRRAYETLGKSVRDSAPDPPPKEVIERAIHALERATTFQPTADSTTDVSIMDTIVEMLVDSDYLKGFVDRVLSWDAKLCAAWMLEDIEYGANMITKFESAAKKEHRVEDMIACYKAAMEATTEEGDALAIRVQLGSMYWKLLEDEDLAHDEFLQIMNTTDSSRHGKQARHNANLLLSEMMYGRIKLAPTVWMRRVLAANLAMFADKDTESGLDIWNIRPNISLATAYLSSNQPQRAAKLLDPTFSVCMEWLRDDVSWNNSTSLRLLAKLLACVGLRKEAAIAYSAGFSKLDDDTEAEGDSYEEPAAKEEPVDDAAAQKENKDTDGTNGENITSENSPPETAINGNQPEDNEDKPEDSASSNNNAIAKPAEKDPQSANRLIPEAEEDLRPSFWGCDGCKKEIRYWVKDEPLYLCLICRDLDLCEDCHAKRVKGNGDGGSNGHVAYCGMNHDYISGPVEGWGGIKGGIMTVQPERVQFTHWLKDIEEGWNEWKLNSSKQESSKQKAGDLERAVERLKLDT